MIGQDKLITEIDEIINNNNLPRFIILTGEIGSGRKTLAKYIADRLNASFYKPENSKVTVDYVRNIIEQAYKHTEPIVFLLPDVDFLNASSANALLKVTEEPPNNAYFIMTCMEKRSIQATLRSRCVPYRLKRYSREVLKNFAESLGINSDEKLFDVCRTPGDVINFVKSENDYDRLEQFTKKVLDNIGTASGANVFKIDESIAFKDDEDKFNLNTFWTVFCNLCMQRTKEIKNSKRNMYLSYIRITSSYREKLLISGINKRSLFDLWILEIRDTYIKYN